MRPIPLNALSKLMSVKRNEQTLVHGGAIDSRAVRPGDLFFALPGKKTDGHCFLAEAASKGAAAAVVSASYKRENFGLPLLPVPNVLDSLQDLARQIVKKRKFQIVAITGSAGKTTTKEFTAALLKQKYRVFASPKSYNSQETVPLSILMASGSEDILVLEMAMTEPGQIQKLTSIAPPDIAVVTSIVLQHATHFPEGLQGIGREKASIFSLPGTRLGILNRDIPCFEHAIGVGKCRKITFSLATSDADYYLEEIAGGQRVFAKGEAPQDIPFHLPMKPFYQNFLAALAVARTFGIPWPAIVSAATVLSLPKMRFQRVEKKGVVFINDAYNSNPESICAALQHLPLPAAGGKKIAVISEMNDLGRHAEESHASVAKTALDYVDILMCIGPYCEAMRKLWEEKNRPFFLFEEKAHLIDAIRKTANPGDVVLLKGARSYALEDILEGF